MKFGISYSFTEDYISLFSFDLKPFCEIYKLSINTAHTVHTSY